MISLKSKDAAAPGLETLKTLRVIVADDVVEIRQLIAQWMEEQGHTVEHASTGREVIRTALARPCDLIITDILMPDGDGLDVIIALKRAHPGIRIVGISGGGKHMTAPDALQLAQAIGGDAMLLKPFTRKQLLEAVERAMENRRR